MEKELIERNLLLSKISEDMMKNTILYLII